MDKKSQITREIFKTFGSQPEVARICASIVSFLEKTDFETSLHITYSILKNETSANSDGELLAAIQYLSGAKAAILKMQYEFIDEHGEFHPIDESIVALAHGGGGFFHPDTGEPVENYANSLMVYFVPTEQAIEHFHRIK